MKRYILYIIGICLLASSCEHKELCFDHAHIQSIDVRFDWSKAPEANPKSMSLYIFPKGAEEGMRYDISNPNGTTIRLPKGVYDVVCFNCDSETALYRNTDRWETIEVSTHETSISSAFGIYSATAPRAEGTSLERVVYSPDPLWSGSMRDYTVENTEDNAPITLYPESVVQTYTLTILNVQNMKYASWFAASISTMAGGVLVAEKEPTDETVTIPFDLTAGTEANSLVGRFNIFGHCKNGENTHQLIIYTQMEGGEKYYYTIDVTEQFHEASESGEFNIVIDGLPLPKPMVNGGGFNPDVDGWGQIDVDITM